MAPSTPTPYPPTSLSATYVSSPTQHSPSISRRAKTSPASDREGQAHRPSTPAAARTPSWRWTWCVMGTVRVRSQTASRPTRAIASRGSDWADSPCAVDSPRADFFFGGDEDEEAAAASAAEESRSCPRVKLCPSRSARLLASSVFASCAKNRGCLNATPPFSSRRSLSCCLPPLKKMFSPFASGLALREGWLGGLRRRWAGLRGAGRHFVPKGAWLLLGGGLTKGSVGGIRRGSECAVGGLGGRRGGPVHLVTELWLSEGGSGDLMIFDGSGGLELRLEKVAAER